MVKFFSGFLLGLILSFGAYYFLNKTGDKKNEIVIDEKFIDSLSVDTKRDYLEERARARKKGLGKND